MAVQVESIEFRVNHDAMEEAFRAFQESDGRQRLPEFDDQRVGKVGYLARLFIEQFIDGKEYSLQVWGWLCWLAQHIGDEHGLGPVFNDQKILELHILNPDFYLVKFNGVEIAHGLKLPAFDPVNERHVPPR